MLRIERMFRCFFTVAPSRDFQSISENQTEGPVLFKGFETCFDTFGAAYLKPFQSDCLRISTAVF